MRNTAASIKDRLLNIAKHEGIPFQRILTLYKQEGLLHRMVSTQLASSIVLKGGLLFFQLQGMVARPTKDIDLLGTSDRSSIDVAPIAGQTEHGGIRGHILAYLGTARTRIQIDMGFGDVITGGPVERLYRTLLGNRSFSIQTYSDETMVAEKIDAIVSLGIINSRYKDLYDLFTLLVDTGISEGAVIEATSNTFSRRQTSLPEKPESLSPRHWDSTAFNAEWNRFLKRIDADSPELPLLRKQLLPRLMSIYSAARTRVLKQ